MTNKDKLDELLRNLQNTAFNQGERYAKQCQEGMSGEMSEYHAPAMHYDRQEVIGKIMGLLCE